MHGNQASPGELRWDRQSQPAVLSVTGDWTLTHYLALRDKVERYLPELGDDTRLELRQLGRLDTAGADLLAQLLGPAGIARWTGEPSPLPNDQRALLATVAAARRQPTQPGGPRPRSITELLAHIGQSMVNIGRGQILLLDFIGQTLLRLLACLPRPQRWRLTSLIFHIEQTGLDAVPIVALLTFLVGAVMAFLGATVLNEFGASIYTVAMVSFAFLREFGVILAAILLAGRSASAFAAQIGAMQANEEIDAIKSLGLNPIDLLVLPRLLAMLITLPILTLVGMLSGIAGGLVVCALALDISPGQFLGILQRDVPIRHFWVGLVKAPIFAFVVAVIGCLEGFKAGGSAKSVGERTTSSVVQAIFMVILLDAVAALFFREMGW